MDNHENPEFKNRKHRGGFLMAMFEWLTPTRATGMIAYGITFSCCILASVWAKGDRAKSRLAKILAFFEALLFLDIVLNLRWILHQFFMDEAARLALYASRRGPQAVVLVVLVLLFLLGVRVVSQEFRGRRGAFLAVSGTLFSLILWCTEVISLHAVDHILYRPIGQWMSVCFLWVIACAMTSIGILIESRAGKKRASLA
jgi:hypothetical protein